MRGGEDRRHARIHVLEPAEVTASDVALVGRDATHVIRILRDQVVVEVGERSPHLARMFLVHAEDDGLGESVGLVEEVGEVPGYGLGPSPERDDTLEVLGLVLVVGDRPAVAVQLILARSPAGGVPLGDHAVHAVGREEAVVDALPQAVLVNRVTEVEVGVAVVVAQGRGGHAELKRGLEVFQNGAPRAVVTRAAAVALVHDHEIEEVGWKGPEQPGASLVLCERLVDREVHLAALDDFSGFDLAPGVAERCEDAVLGLVDEDVAISEIEDFGSAVFAGAVPAGTPELPAYLERDRSLARAGSHRDEQAASARENALHDAVDRNLLVVALALTDCMVGRRE